MNTESINSENNESFDEDESNGGDRLSYLEVDSAASSNSEQLSNERVRQSEDLTMDILKEVVGYYPDKVKTVVTWVFIVLTVGLLRLFFYWKPALMVRCTHDKCTLRKAVKVILKDQYDQLFVEAVQEMKIATTSRKDSSLRAQRLSGSGEGPYIPHTPSTNNTSMDHFMDSSGQVRYFVSKKIKYVWNTTKEEFEKLKGLDTDHTCSFFHQSQPLSVQEQAHRRRILGENMIDVRVDSIVKLLFTQMLNPFYIFQIFSCALWFSDEYYYYAAAIVLMSVASLTAEVYQTRAMQKALKSTVSASDIVSVCRDTDEYERIPSDLLVPGDIIEIPRNGGVMQCDAVLLTGNCIVNESMLTGESVPVTKTPLPNSLHLPGKLVIPFSLKEHGRHILFCGTRVIQTRYYGKQKVKAVVLRTGFNTAKGELVRSIMFPKPMDFRFSQDTYKFIGVLAGIASGGMVYTLVVMTQTGTDAGTIIKRMLDLVTIIIPPALPAAMTIGTVFAQRRLKKEGIFCISPKRINMCGTINTFCFDKTGTLTSDGLDLRGVVPMDGLSFGNEVNNIPDLGREPLMVAMTTCHSLTIIEGELCGDPLDLRMFESTGWDLEEPGEDTSKFDVFMPTLVRPKTPDVVRTSENFDSTENMPFEVGILRQFTFSSRLQRMSVIARTLEKNHFDLYTKGAPEMIASLSRPETVPKDFHDILLKYTHRGYRVLALAWKPLKKLNYVKVQRAQREQMERGLTFLGLLVMENCLKPRTTPIIHQLKEANIRPIMITGDNMLTALSVARDCEMIEPRDKVILVQVVPPTNTEPACVEWNYVEEVNKKNIKEIMTRRLQEAITVVSLDPRQHFAITGRSWLQMRLHFPDLLSKLVVRGTVFARFSPEQKQQLVECLQELGYYVGMCGDGANDCGALKTAHTGISLSEAEASVASPFTSRTADISCVPTTIREGRAALVTSFGVFKYMAGYSMTQFLSVCMLYWIGANLTDFVFLYIDLFIITSLAATYGYTGAYEELVPEPPPVSLISLAPIASIILQLIVISGFQIFVWFFVLWQPWFEAFVRNEDDDYYSYEMTALFVISSFQYITLAVVYSKGPPYRKTLFSNVLFLVNLIVITGLTVWVVIYPTDGLADFLELKMFPSLAFRGIIVGLAFINFLLCLLLEMYVLDSQLVTKRWEDAIHRRSRIKAHKYLTIEQELHLTPDWPPISQSTQSLAELMQLESTPVHPASGGGTISPVFESDDDDSCTHSNRGRVRTFSQNSSVSQISEGMMKTPLKMMNVSSPDDWTAVVVSDQTPILPDSPTSPSLPLLESSFSGQPANMNKQIPESMVVDQASAHNIRTVPDETKL